MRPLFSFSKIAVLLLFIFICSANSYRGFAQILVYTNDTNGILNSVALHAKGDTLERVNGAIKLTPPCTRGFSTKNFTNVTSWSDTLEAVQVSVAPDTMYILKIDTLRADLRYSTTGPASARFAYSTDSINWISQGTDQLPKLSTFCGDTVTCAWPKSLTVTYPKRLFFRIYGFNASGTTGNLQILNLNIKGTVPLATSLSSGSLGNTDMNFSVYPNPIGQSANISYNLSNEEKVNMSIYNVVGQLVTNVINEVQQPGNHDYTIPVTAPGIYFVKLTVGEMVLTRKIVKL